MKGRLYAFGTGAGGNDRCAVIDCLYHFALYTCTVTQGNYHYLARSIQVCQLFFTDKALDDDTVSRLL